MFWKIYNKQSGVMVDKVWYIMGTQFIDVYDMESENFDFDILIVADSED